MAIDSANNTLALYPNRYVVFAAHPPYHNFSNTFLLLTKFSLALDFSPVYQNYYCPSPRALLNMLTVKRYLMKTFGLSLDKRDSYRAECISLCKTILAMPSIILPSWLYLVVCKLFVFLAMETEDTQISLDATNMCLQNPNKLDVLSQQEFRYI